MSRLPSVTTIIREVGLSRSYPNTPEMELARQRGTALHAAILLHAGGELDEGSLHEAIRPGFEAYLRFLDETGHIEMFSEYEIEHPWGIIGHLDRVSSLIEILDWKYSDSPDLVGAKYQLAGYRLLWNHQFPLSPVSRCLVIGLGKNGKYRPHDVTDDYAMQVFTSAFVVYKARQENVK